MSELAWEGDLPEERVAHDGTFFLARRFEEADEVRGSWHKREARPEVVKAINGAFVGMQAAALVRRMLRPQPPAELY